MFKTRQRVEFGDFQTPRALADEVCRLLLRNGLRPATIVEPTCGKGSLLLSALDHFPSAEVALGVDVNPEHVACLTQRLASSPYARKVRLVEGDFFTTDWPSLLNDVPQPLLVLGNPPWVTNAALETLGSRNLPEKSNFQRLAGYDAVTGKSNFDISEWMLLRVLEWLDGRDAVMAMLCKTIVARKLLAHAWGHDAGPSCAALYRIDAGEHFGANVDACLLICKFGGGDGEMSAPVFPDLGSSEPLMTLGWRGQQIVSDVAAYDRYVHLASTAPGGPHVWRSGVKHDCANVMEFTGRAGAWVNKLGEIAAIEPTFLFPMLKSSEVAQGRTAQPKHAMLVTQNRVGDETDVIARCAPLTWKYLLSHADRLDGRRSAIYRKRPRFSVFGVGDYTFAPFKVAISGFYKRFQFEVVGNMDDRPIVFDDTVYFLPCQSRDEADFLAGLLNSPDAQGFYKSLVFWEAKRPITVDLLNRLDLRKVAAALGCEALFEAFVSARAHDDAQSRLF